MKNLLLMGLILFGLTNINAESSDAESAEDEAKAEAKLEANVEAGDKKKKKPKLPLKADRTVQFTTSEVTWLSLDVSPDGQTLVFDVLGDLYLLPITGGKAQSLTTGMGFDSQPKFSPDGERVLYVSDREGTEGLMTIALDSREIKKITKGGNDTEFASPSWSPDGQHVLASKSGWKLRTNELWAYDLDGGKGVQITKAKKNSKTLRSQRSNSLGAVYSPDGRYLYYAKKIGGFQYNAQSLVWQIVKRDLVEGTEDLITQAQGSAMRPVLSPDGNRLIYATRYEAQTGLRVRNLVTGEDKWLLYPVQRDDQESRFTRDLMPGYAFTPDGKNLLFTKEGGIQKLNIASGTVTKIEFEVTVDQALGPRLYFPYRVGVGPVKSRLLMHSTLSPNGDEVAFAAFMQIHVHNLKTGVTRVVSDQKLHASQPVWAPNGKKIAFVTWGAEGGAIWEVRATGRGNAKMLTTASAYYSQPTYSPDGSRVVALRAPGYNRLSRESDFGVALGSDVVWLPSKGGDTNLVLPARGLGKPHFSMADDRILLYLTPGTFGDGASGLYSIRYDGTDAQLLVTVEGIGIYAADENVPAADVRLSPDGKHALVLHASQLYLLKIINPHLRKITVDVAAPIVPLQKVTDVGADYFGWTNSGKEIYWSAGNQFFRRALSAVRFLDEDEKKDRQESVDDELVFEDHESVTKNTIEVYRPRHKPQGTLALVGGTVVTMENEGHVYEQGTVLIEGDRIVAVGSDIEIPVSAKVFDITGRWVFPGYIDTHAHYRPMRGVLDANNWSFLANLAYGVTTGLDVQPSTVDILAYQDMIDAGLMMGPRTLSTGPGIFSNNNFTSKKHAKAVLKRYKDGYRVHNLKSYIVGGRKQRQWLVQAAKELELMPTTEGALDMKLDMTHVIDGFSGNEHNLPLPTLYTDVIEFVAQSEIAYTPILLVVYGGPSGENDFYIKEQPQFDQKLNRFMPHNVLARRTERRAWFADSQHVYADVAAQAAKIVRAGGKVGVGAHGQLQGLGYHWELWGLARGMTNYEVLTAATRHGAEMIGVAEDLGTVSEGKLADLLILTADPRENIRHSRDIEFVVKNGEVFEGDTLDKRWPEEEALGEQWWQQLGPPTSQNEGVSRP